MKVMARGWESKSVESQQDAVDTHASDWAPLTDIEQQIHVLELSRKHVLDEMEASRNPRFVELKMKALRHLEGQIAALRAGL
jgi:hypothetical protein